METKRRGILFCLIGPAGGGKTTFCQELYNQFKDSTEISVSLTSRAMRPGEVEGKSYFFVSRAEFEKRIKAGELFEWEEVHDNLYGTLKSTLDQAVSRGVDLLLDIDIRGAINLKSSFPKDAVIIFLVPPSFAELRRRVEARSAMSDAEFKRRIETAKQEYSTLLGAEKGEIDYFVVNHTKEETYQIVRSILQAERSHLSRLEAKSVRAICAIPENW